MNEMRTIEADTTAARPAASKRRRWIALMLSVPLLIAVAGLYFWLTSGKTISTDNAFVGAPTASVAPEVSGKIIDVAVAENKQVKAGDLLFRIDPAPFRIAVMQAEAAAGNAQLQIAQMSGTAASRDADVANKQAEIGSARAAVILARQSFNRQAELMKRGFTTRAQLDAAQADLVSAQQAEAAAVAAQRSAVESARASRAMLGAGPDGVNPLVEAAAASRAQAQLNLARTEVRAPIGGRITGTDRLQVGNVATQSLPIVSIVGSSGYWIEANFKETQLAKVRIGQRATVEIDALPGREFAAQVTGIGAGTGSEFSLLPAQNATGNWVKVTQRVPVRLMLLEKPDIALVTGWSAKVTVRVAD